MSKIKALKASKSRTKHPSSSPPQTKKGKIHRRIAQQNNSDQNSNELTTFVISAGMNSVRSKNRTPGKWIKYDEKTAVQGKIIPKGLFFFGGQLESINGTRTEASLIDETLPVKHISSFTSNDSTIGYWPRYNQLSEKERGIYLHWLANGRNHADTPLSYVFIYFYGLERRILVDYPKNLVDYKEFELIFNEIIRLRKTYGHSFSFSNYSASLLEYMLIQNTTLYNKATRLSFKNNNSELFRYKLSKTVARNLPISPNLAFEWVLQSKEYILKTPARRCSNEFKKLFLVKYTQQYNTGLVVPPNKTRLVMNYFPASDSLQGINIPQQDLPDPSILKRPLKKLIEIASETTEALEKYSRYLGKKDSKKTDLRASLLLPKELETTSELFTNFKEWTDHKIETKKGIVEVTEIWTQLGEIKPEKINKKEIDFLDNLLSKINCSYAPNPSFHDSKPFPNGIIVIFNNKKNETVDHVNEFAFVGMNLHLGCIMAMADDHLDETELKFLTNTIDKNKDLSIFEKNALHAYLTWKLNSPLNLNKLRKKLSKLTETEKNVVCTQLQSIVLVDGIIDNSEIKLLEKIYKALGIEQSKVISDLHNHSCSLSKPEQDNNNNLLDNSKLQTLEKETKDVQKILSEIFTTEQETLEEPVPQNQKLDDLHLKLFKNLEKKEVWSKDEFEKKCQELNLMANAAIETINEWAYEITEAPIIEDEYEELYIDQEILNELRG